MKAGTNRSLLLAAFVSLGCQGKSVQPEQNASLNTLQEHERRVDRLVEDANVFIEYASSGGSPQYFVRKPELDGGSEIPRARTEKELVGLLNELDSRRLAVVQLEKRTEPWPEEELDRIEETLRTAGFERVVVFQATAFSGSPILRE